MCAPDNTHILQWACNARPFLSVESNQNVETKTENVESKIAFLLQEIRKIIKTAATICQILRLNAPKSNFG